MDNNLYFMLHSSWWSIAINDQEQSMINSNQWSRAMDDQLT